MQLITKDSIIDIAEIESDNYWDIGESSESLMHKIHAYPAKFPAFITNKAIEYATNNGLEVKNIADIFCGCGTVALEAQKNHKNFWGWDINPVAILIAKVKSNNYNVELLKKYYDTIINNYQESKQSELSLENINDRIRYWFTDTSIHDLYFLKQSILKSTKNNSKYRLYFLCAFSNILKPTSRWLTKSIKPQIDPNKKQVEVLHCFSTQCKMMHKAVSNEQLSCHVKSQIKLANSLKIKSKELVELIVTSPPYVTSYEYADLHQLSSLWLDYTDDYRTLRTNSVGSSYGINNFEYKKLNKTGKFVIDNLKQISHSKLKSVGQYFIDMQIAAKISYNLLKSNGMILFIIGNTEYKNVYINKAKHLVESLYNAGFSKVYISKRKITGKILTPYRDSTGKFAASKNTKEVYSEEFVIIGRK